jgi:Cyclic nucleotide-binding domain
MTDIQGSQPGSVKDAGITAVVVLPLPPTALTGYLQATGSERVAGPLQAPCWPIARHPPRTHTLPGGSRHTGKGQPPPWRPGTCCGEHGIMRYESSVTSLSWIPSEAVTGGARVAFDSGFTHYDDPPPAQIDDLEALRAADRFRFANVLRAWIDVDGAGEISGGGYSGGGHIGDTTIRMGGLRHTFQNALLPDLRRDPERGDGWVRFVQTVGGRTSMPAPRRVRHPPYIQWQAPLVWTTLSLTLHADGTAERAMTGASRFPRHWLYDADGRLTHKSGLTDFTDWMRVSFGRQTPWGDRDSEALVTAVESALEHQLSVQLMRGAAKPRVERLPAGAVLVRQGEPGTDVYLVLDGVIRVEREGEWLAEYGPGAMLGERAHLEGGTRTSTLVAITACRVASVDATQFDRSALTELSGGHRREDAGRD